MLTVIIVGGLTFIILHEISRKNRDWKLQRISFVIFWITVLLLPAIKLCNLAYLSHNDYNKVTSYSYVTKDGTTETVNGEFWERNGVFYKYANSGKAAWIPFYLPEMEEIEIPTN